MKVLLTGFGPFLNISRNPSWEAVKLVNGIDGVEIVKECLPVSFKGAKNKLEELIPNLKPDIIVLTGVSSLFGCLVLTASAINIIDSEHPDNDGYIPNWENIYENAPIAYLAKAPLKKIRDTLRQNGIPTLILNSIDFYVCNTAFYTALHLTRRDDSKVCFIHVPMASEFSLNKISPNLPLETIKRGIELTIKVLLDSD